MGVFIIWLLVLLWCASDEQRLSSRMKRKLDRENRALSTAIERGICNEYFERGHSSEH